MPYQSINPYTEEPIQTYPQLSDAELDGVLEQAATVFQGDWRHRSYQQRGAVLHAAAEALRVNVDKYASLAVREMGKLIGELRDEVRLSADILDYYAQHAEAMLAPRLLETTAAREAWIETQPIGPLLCIEPWNLPYYQAARVIGPQLMAGNTIVLKHSSGVPGCAAAIHQLLLDAGAPPGVYTNVYASGDQVDRAIADERVQGVALTGSDAAGSTVAAAAGKALKKSTMELGGSDAFLVLEDADLDTAVRLAVQGRMMNTGQACAASKRFIVHESLADAFTARFHDALIGLQAGDPLDEHTTLGPLSSQDALDRVLKQIGDAVAHGARVRLGGQRLERRGFFLAPTILEGIEPSNPAFSQEFFAPVALLFRVGSDEEAISLANNSPFGLGGSVITADAARGRAVAAQMNTGMVFINNTVISTPELPFGGVKHSGFGRELSDLGIGEFVNRKLVTVS